MSDDQRGSEGNPAGGPPNPFSREGSDGDDAFTPDPPAPSSNGATPPPATADWTAREQPPAPPSWPTYPPTDAPAGPESGTGHTPYAAPPYQGPYAPPSANPVSQQPPPPSFDPQPTGPYGTPSANPGYPAPPAASYGAPGPDPNYQQPPAAPYGPPPASYGSNPYEVNPYQPSYGGYSPYGMGAGPHPKANTALIFGIIGMVLVFGTCIGGFVGIGGIINGRTARAEIDADPQRYTGRSAANWGFGLGVTSTVLAGLGVILFIIGIAAGGFES